MLPDVQEAVVSCSDQSIVNKPTTQECHEDILKLLVNRVHFVALLLLIFKNSVYHVCVLTDEIEAKLALLRLNMRINTSSDI